MIVTPHDILATRQKAFKAILGETHPGYPARYLIVHQSVDNRLVWRTMDYHSDAQEYVEHYGGIIYDLQEQKNTTT